MTDNNDMINDILNQLDKEKVYAGLLDWIQKRD